MSTRARQLSEPSWAERRKLPETLTHDTEPPSGGRRVAAKRRGKGRRGRTVGYVLLSSLLIVALVTALSVVYVYSQLNRNITTDDITDELGDRPEVVEVQGPGEPINVLVMGSDSREGSNNIDGLTEDGERSDTTILLHLSADRTRAYGISIPRDSMVDRPSCKSGRVPAGRYMWNDAFGAGGKACTVKQFEQITGIRVTHWVVIDFTGFRDMVDALGGVPVCVPEPGFEDPEHGIRIPAGRYEIKGDQALSYVRVRHIPGTDGSDLGRIKRQQAFMASMTNKVVSGGTLARPDRVFGFLKAVTKSLTLDQELGSLSDIGELALEVNKVGLDNIRFITVPWQYDPADLNRVVWLPEADKLWRKILHDKPLPKNLVSDSIGAAAPPGGKKKPTPTGTATPSATPSDTPTAEPTGMSAEEAAANGLCS